MPKQHPTIRVRILRLKNLSALRGILPKWAAFTLFALGSCGAWGETAVPAENRLRFPNSIREISAQTSSTAGRPTLVRSTLKPEESGALMDFEVALRMRSFPELQARVARGELIPAAEMAQKYYPLTAADHDRVVRWIKSQGLSVVRTDSNRLAVFGRGTVTAVQQAFQVTFARVAAHGAEFTSAVTAPSLPAEFASAIQGIHGLQPHLRPHPLPRAQG